MTVFPTNIQTFTTHTTGDVINPDFDNEQQDTLTGLQVKVGVDNSSDINSIDYQLSGVASGDKAVSKTGTETLTNKTLTAPIVTGATITTSTVNGVTLTTGGSATDFLAANGTYQTGAVSNASTTVKGIVELATAAEISAGTATGGTGAALVVSADTVTFSEFGNGIDGALTYDGTTTILGMAPSSNIYTLTRDIYGTTIVVNSGVTIETGGYKIYAKTSLSNAGTIKITPNNGGNASGITGGTAGVAVSGGVAGVAGANGFNHGAGGATPGTNGTVGIAQTTSIGVSGVAGGGGGNAGGGGSTGGGTGALTASTQGCKHILHSTSMYDFYGLARLNGSSGSGSGGSGGTASGVAGTTGAGGGSGGTGGIVWIGARVLTNTGTISANGGNGGNGAAATGSDGGGGGGAGGSGGVVVLNYKSITLGTVTVTGGTGGSAGSGTPAGSAGSNGNTGTIIQIAC